MSEENLCTYTNYKNGNLACIPKGIRILTNVGYIKVEKLKIKDLIITQDNRLVPIIKIFKSTHEYNNNTAPRIIPKDMFFKNYPPMDIKLSTGHGIFVGDFIFIDCLCNDYKDKIIIEPKENFKKTNYKIDYYHIVLPDFFSDNLIIEGGTIIESFPYNLDYQHDYNYSQNPINNLYKKYRINNFY